MLTERAKLLFIVLAVTLVIAWVTQFELIYFIVAVILSIILLSFLLFKLTLFRINCTRDTPIATYEDETIEIKVTLENNSILPNYFVYLIDNFPADLNFEQEKRLLIPYLHKRAVIKWNYKGLCFKRGVYWIGPFTLIGSDPLGLFKKHKVINISSKLTVYPKIFKINCIPPFEKGAVTPRYGSSTSRRSGDYEEFYGIREYRQEDGLRKIHWPSSAKHNELIVRHFEQSGIHAVTIILDLKNDSNLGFSKETTLEYSVKIAASLCKYFLDIDSIVQLLAFADKPIISSSNKGSFHFFSLLELLAQMEATSPLSLSEAIAALNPFIQPMSTLIMIRLDEDFEAAKAAEQLIYLKNVSLIEIQLIAQSFDKSASKHPAYYIQAKAADIKTYRISCGTNLENYFNLKT